MSLTHFSALPAMFLLTGINVLWSQETATPSREAEKLLKEAGWQRAQVMKDSFEPAIRDLSRNSSEEYRALYLSAVYEVFFAKDLKPQQAFREWQKKNTGLVSDSRLPIATELAAANLQGHLYLILEDQPRAINCFLTVLKGIQEGPDNLTGFHLLQESLGESLLTKYYRIEDAYLKEDGGYSGAIANVEKLFNTSILPWYEQHQPREIAALWDMLIIAKSKAASLSKKNADQFAIAGHAELLLAKAASLEKIGQKKQAIAVLKELLQKFPLYPKYKDIEARFLQLSAE
ncbi:MAG: hypothetical protein LBK76_01570 [Verrucomicrobiales bacterium]|jgi:tetratricopeptide (TPR) repeat protein|nr:hypothetical protein [Verrucomicrobiales bacterium]